MSNQVVGIELGSGSVRVLALDKCRGGWRICCAEERPIPFDEALPEQPIIDALTEVFSSHALSRSAVAVSLPAYRCIFRNFAVNFTSDEQIEQVVKYETENHLPTTSIEKVVVNHYRVSGDSTRTQLLVSVVDKSLIARALEILQRCGIDPLTIDIDLMAALNSYRRCGVLDRPGRTLVVQIDEHATNISLLIDGQLQFVRSLKLGTASVECADPLLLLGEDPLEGLDVGTDLQLDLGALERDLALAGPTLESGGHQPLSNKDLRRQAQRRFNERLVQQLRRTLLSARQGAPDAVVLAGMGASMAGVRDALTRHFGHEVELASVLESLPHALSTPDEALGARLPAVLGLALKLTGLDEGRVELRQDEFRFARSFEQVQGRLVLASCLLFAVVVACCFQVRRAQRAVRGEYATLYHQAVTLFEGAIGVSAPERLGNVDSIDPRRRIPMMLAELEEARTVLDQRPDVAPIDGLEAWRLVSVLLADYGGTGLRLQVLRIDEHEVHLEGEVAARAGEQALWSALLQLARARPDVFDAPQNRSEPLADKSAVQFSFHLPFRRSE